MSAIGPQKIMGTSQEEGHVVKAEDNSDMTLLSYSKKILEPVADNAIPTMAFLLLDPTKMQNKGTGSNYHDELRDAFQEAVKIKTMDNLRMCLQQFIAIILKKSQEKLKTNQTVSLLSNFTVNELDECNEAILRLKEVLPQFSYQVPKDVKDAFEKICKEKRIPAKDAKGNDKEFFVFSEIKALRKICDALSEEEVCHMYDNLMKKKEKKNYSFHKTSTGETLSELKVSSSDLKNIMGMKEASFYCFVVGLSKEGLLNRVHTHHLYNYLKNDHETDAASRFESALNMYPLASKPPGICIIFNVEEDREGAKMDLAKVKELFQETFKYDVVPVENPKKEDVSRIIEELKADRNRFYDSLVVVFMSHGNEHCLKLADGEMLHRRKDLIEPITNIDWLAKKPKLFFQQACAEITQVKSQGTQTTVEKDGQLPATNISFEKDGEAFGGTKGELENVPYIGGPERAEYVCIAYACSTSCMNSLYEKYIQFDGLHPFADTLISYPTKWYEVAARCRDSGSPYINILVEKLKRHGTKESIQEVLLRVHYNTNMLQMEVKTKKEGMPHRQAPYFESSLQKKFMFPQQ